ncbi:MAG: DMT family transporter [Melioribacteraceae bacterium]|nr:DMT family transporter [Melioribacteraceae bacterium]
MSSTLGKIWKPLVAVIFWGASFVATKHLLDTLSPLGIIYIRLILGIAAALFIAIIRKRNFVINKKDLKGIFILALISITHLWIQVYGMQYTSASNTGWIIGIIPVIMAIMGFIFYKERMNSMQITGAVIAFVALLILISKGDLKSLNFITNYGDLLVLGSAFTWSVYSFYGRKVTLSYPPSLTILYLFITMFILLSPITISSDFFNAVISLSEIDWGALIFLGILCSGLAYVLWAEAMNELPANRVGAFLYLEPFVTVFTAWLLLNENITLLMMISGIVIIIGVIMVNRK